MTDLRDDGMNHKEPDDESATEATANEPSLEGRAVGVELDRMSRRLGERIRSTRKTRNLKLI